MKKILVIIGEVSGDLHGGLVLKKLKRMIPSLKIIGTGGKIFQQVADKMYFSVEDLAVVGFFEVLQKLKRLKKIFATIVEVLDFEKPDAVFLVDYVGFNLKLAEEAKKRNIKVYFYVSPQVWAWRKNRTKKMKEVIDELIVLFPFEVDYLAKRGIQAKCFGHPLLDIVKTTKSKSQIIREYGLKNDKYICIFPGSREQEIKRHIPILFKSILLLEKKIGLSQFVFIAPTLEILQMIKTLFQKSDLRSSLKSIIIFSIEDRYNLIEHSDLVLAKVGTVTLETTILTTPLIIFYRVSWITYFLAKHIFRVKNLALPNIIAKKIIIPELIQASFNPTNLVKHLLDLLEKGEKYQTMKEELSKIKFQLGNRDAYNKTAIFLAKLLQNK